MLQRFQSIDANISDDALDILELFAQTESLTITQITDIVRSTIIERAYKNVYYKIQKLKSLNLIEEAKVDKKRLRHNEKHFKLTDEGIYQLFRKMRYHGILVDQLSVKKGGMPVSYVDNFLKYYGNNALFELFLYPYFGRQTISADNIGLLVKLFRYLHNCCKQIDAAKIGYVVPHFFWNKIPGENNDELLASLKEIFDLENIGIDNSHIEKTSDNSTITVTAPQVGVVIKLDPTRKKAITTVDMDNNIRKYEYTILDYASEIMACMPKDDKSQALDSTMLVEAPIYELVSSLGESGASQEQMNNNRLLAKDTTFMMLLEKIHNNFEKGYCHLMDLRIKSQ